MKSFFLWDYTSDEIKTMAPDHIAIQPVASVEQHGPHLPLGTDSMIVNAFAARLRERFQAGYPGLFLPLMPYGKSNEHLRFPGTITYSAQTFLSVLMDIGRSCARAGFQKLVFLNGHGGNHSLLDVAVRELRIETGMQVFALHPLITILPESPADIGCPLTPEEARLGIHAGRIETAVILRAHPELVRQDQMGRDYPACFDGCRQLDFSGRVSYGWMTQDVSRSGTIGDPCGATAEEGERWLSSVTDLLYQALLEIQSFGPLEEAPHEIV
ncbi:MAG: creatininase family protein [Oscillospiraceae bacterium]|nr:creatininase family protein [Oscillospiraceae bacterium]